MPYADAVARKHLRGRLLALVALIAAGCVPSGSRGTATAPAASPGVFPVSPVIAQREWRWNSVQGLEIRTAGWQLRCSVANTALRESLPVFYEAALANYRSGLVPLPELDRPLEAYVFGSRAEWVRFTEHRLGADAGPYLKMGRGGFTSEGVAVLYDIGERDTLSIAAHEGWHQYSQTMLRNPLPVWLEEGIACFMEGFRRPKDRLEPQFLPWRNPERFAELRASGRRGSIVGLRELLDGSPQSFLGVSRDAQLTYYAQVWALVHFLRDGEGGRYRAGLERLLADALDGKVVDSIRASKALPDDRARRLAETSKSGLWPILVYFDDDFGRFERGYARFLGELVESSAWDRVMRGECPIGLAPDPQAPGAPPAPRSPGAALPAAPVTKSPTP